MNKKELKKKKKVIYDLICSKDYQPMRVGEMAVLLQLSKSRRKELREVLEALAEEGKIKISKQGRYHKAKTRERGEKKPEALLRGTFIGHARGYGFVELADSEEQDIFIPENQVNQAFHQDLVEIRLLPENKGKRREGQVLRVLKHGITEVVGTFEQGRHYGFVVADNSRIQQDIFIPREHAMGAVDGDKVVASITGYGSRNKSPEGRIIEILGSAGEPGVDVLSVARGYGLPMEFPVKVLHQAQRIPALPQEQDYAGRLDLRGLLCVTIDGEDAKDLDDAITISRTDKGYRLGVHIADVANYVQENSALDREARKRGTSVYLVDRVIPMLPKELSNGICSLNQGEDRLALSCLMELDDTGNVVSHQLAETVIRVDHRMSYTQVWQILQGEEEQQEAVREAVPMLFLMEELSARLRSLRQQRGAIDFDFPESKVYLDGQGHPVEIRAYERNRATEIIEDFMLIANETVAREFRERELPFVYRVHEEPDADRIEQVFTFLRGSQVPAIKGGQRVTPAEIREILSCVKGQPLEPMVSRLLLRSMKQARYDVENIGHFGLAARYYCHFTSPIRRYPDLQIHRIIKDVLRGRMRPERIVHYRELLGAVTESASTLERRAEEVERETVKMKKAEYMRQHLGESFIGVISGVTSWGLYVELENTIEGLVSMNSMWDDYYLYDEETPTLVGENNKKTYRLGQKVEIVVEDADVLTKAVDFRLKRGLDGDDEKGNGQSVDCE